MAKKRTTQNEEVIISDNVEAEVVEAPVVETVKMARYDRAEPVDVPADQVERYKKSDWKVV